MVHPSQCNNMSFAVFNCKKVGSIASLVTLLSGTSELTNLSATMTQGLQLKFESNEPSFLIKNSFYDEENKAKTDLLKTKKYRNKSVPPNFRPLERYDTDDDLVFPKYAKKTGKPLLDVATVNAARRTQNLSEGSTTSDSQNSDEPSQSDSSDINSNANSTSPRLSLSPRSDSLSQWGQSGPLDQSSSDIDYKRLIREAELEVFRKKEEVRAKNERAYMLRQKQIERERLNDNQSVTYNSSAKTNQTNLPRQRQWQSGNSMQMHKGKGKGTKGRANRRN